MNIILLKKYLIVGIALLIINSSFISFSLGFPNVKDNSSKNPSLETGDYFRYMLVDGRIRSYWLHIPPSYANGDPLPIVFVLHGSGVGANSISTKIYCDMDEKADEEGFIILYPNGNLLLQFRVIGYDVGRYNNSFWMEELTGRKLFDDTGFIRELIEKMQNNYNINSF